jgi:RNA polymerase sigma factor (TIGR02999 family)
VMQLPANSVSTLLARWQAGDEEALNDVISLVYKELRRIAHRRLRGERPNHTLQSTELVHEAYLRLERQRTIQFENRDHFLAISAELMRQILVEYARKRRTLKRDGGLRLTLDDTVALKTRDLDLVALDDALNELAAVDPQQSRIVVLRFFSGLSIEETAREVGLSQATVKRRWETARLWLHRAMRKHQ